MDVPSSKDAVIFMLSLLPTIPRSVLEDPISLAIVSSVIFAATFLTVISIDEVMPPKVPMMVVLPAATGTSPRFMPPQMGFDVKSATDTSLEKNDTRR